MFLHASAFWSQLRSPSRQLLEDLGTGRANSTVSYWVSDIVSHSYDFLITACMVPMTVVVRIIWMRLVRLIAPTGVYLRSRSDLFSLLRSALSVRALLWHTVSDILPIPFQERTHSGGFAGSMMTASLVLSSLTR